MTALRWIGREAGVLIPLLAATAVLLGSGRAPRAVMADPSLALPIFIGLFAVVLCAAHAVALHAEALAHHYGEPFGTLILTLSAVVVEVLMVSAMMLHAGHNPTMARDTIFSTLMLIINGQIGVAVLLGGIRHGEQHYNLKSSNAYFSMIFAFAGLGLFLPAFVAPESLEYLYLFLIFAFLALYGIFLRLQMKEHRYFFAGEQGNELAQPVHEHIEGPRGGLYHAGMLLGAVLAVAFLSEGLAIVLDIAVERRGIHAGWASLAVAILILSPEALTAIRAGLDNHMQRVVNISLGSALSTIGLTIPAVLLISLLSGRSITLGLPPDDAVMLLFTLLVGMRSYSMGETNILQGFIHFVLLVAFIVLIVI
jgi:Ca2+:H+ antiporter